MTERAETTKGAGEPARKDVPQKQRWKIAFDVLMMMIWVFSSVIVAQLVVGYIMVWIIGTEAFKQPVPTAVFSALSYIVALLMVMFVPVKLSRIRNKKAGGKKAVVSRNVLGLNGLPTWTDIGLAPVGFIVYLILAAILMGIFSAFPWFDAEQAQDVGFSYYVQGLDRAVAFLTLVVMAPIAEEVIFRGWLYGKIRIKLSKIYANWVTIVITSLLVSLLFGIVHLQWNVGVNVFALSIVLCGLREITGTIYAGILLHMLKNGIAFYLLYIA